MEIKSITNEKGEILKTKDGKELKQFTFEEGDIFIPQWNSISVKEVEIEKDGEKEIVENYKLLCHVMHKNDKGEWVQVLDSNQENSRDIFVTLTPAQANSLMNKIKGIKKDDKGNVENVEPVDITQNKFRAYSYYHEKRKKNYIGVGFNPSKPTPKTFEDFEENLEEEE